MNIKQQYCGQITIIGKPNVGKSTLLNQIIGKKISIVSRKKNTTQKNIIGIKTENFHQAIYIDTPGIIINNKKNNFYKNLKNSTLIMFVIDQIYWTEHDEIIFNRIKKSNIPIIIIINKIDKINNKKILLPFINLIKKKNNIKEIIPISAKKMHHLMILKNIIQSYLPQSNHIYPKDYITTNSQLFTISEIIREQLILFLGDELPSILEIKIESFEKTKTGELNIRAIILIENTRQRKIIIGYKGEKIKKISIFARYRIEKEFYIKTHLFLWIKTNFLKK